MKQKDIALLVVVVMISIGFSLLLSRLFISAPKNRHQEVEVVTPITADFPTPDRKYFNEKSIDPTILIKIGSNKSGDPFKN